MLSSFSLDLTLNTLTLSFSETIHTTTLNIAEITLSSAPATLSQDLMYTLTPVSMSVSGDFPEITINLHRNDLNELKRRTSLTVSNTTTYISISSFAINDTFGNPVTEVLLSDALLVTKFTEDTIPAVFEMFELDLDQGTITLFIDETVNTSTLITTGITLLSSSTQPAPESYQLEFVHDNVTAPSNIITIKLANNDLNEIKVRQLLAVDEVSSFIQVDSQTIEDMNGNLITPSPIVRIRVNGFTEDTTPPELLTFNIDMDSGELRINFNEAILSSSLQFNHFALINNETFVPTPVDPDDQHQLTGGTLLSGNGPEIAFRFSIEDLNEIKRKDMCTRALGREDCYIVFRSAAVQDMNINNIDGCRQVDA